MKKIFLEKFSFTMLFGVVGFSIAEPLALGFLGLISGTLLDIYVLLLKMNK